MINQAFQSMTYHSIFLAPCMHASYETPSEMLNAKIISKGQENMGDLLEARINAIEQIQENFGHEIQEIKKELARLAKLVEPCIEAKVGHPQKSSLSPTRLGPRFCQCPSPQQSIPVISDKAYCSNLWPPSSRSESHPERPRANTDRI